MSNPRILISYFGGNQYVFLYDGTLLVGGWMNQKNDKAADIAAEVLKVALPNAPIIPTPNDRDETLKWWDKIPAAQETFKSILESLYK